MRFLASMLPVLAAVTAVSAQILPSAHVSGRVVDERTRVPIPGARVSLSSASGNAPVPVQQTITDQDGRYAFQAVAAGRYRVDVQKSGILPLADETWARTVTVTDGQDVEDWNVTVQRGGAIAGRILDQFGEPLADVTIRAVRHEGPGAVPSQATVNRPLRSDFRARIMTNDLGEFRVYGLVPGEYLISAERPQWDGYRNISADMTLQASTFYPGVSDASAAQPITVSSGETVGGVEFRLLTNPGFTVAGVIVDQAGAPVAGILVILRAASRFDASGGVVEGPVGLSSSDANGRFVLGNLASGSYHVGVEAPHAALRKAMLDGSVGSYIVTDGVPPAPGADPMALTVTNATIEDLRIVLQFRQSP
jgi:hypothetical protein